MKMALAHQLPARLRHSFQAVPLWLPGALAGWAAGLLLQLLLAGWATRRIFQILSVRIVDPGAGGGRR
jgi:hypothetical protein